MAESATAALVPVGVYPSYSNGSEHGLVVLAMGLPYWLEPLGDRYALLVEAPAEAAVREQLARFDRESIGWPPPALAPVDGARPVDLATPLIWAVLVLGAFRLQLQQPDVVNAGALDAAAIFERGEIWRLGTALFLHADLGHLVSNLASGIFVFAAVTSTMGRRAGWLWITLAALAGNFVTALARYPTPYVSIGASTAIFGALGLLTGRAVCVAARSKAWRWRAMFVPLAAGLSVLGLYGAGGVRIDLGAHVCGFAAGFGFGVAVSRRITVASPRA
jgi:rhomboid protease GluP